MRWGGTSERGFWKGGEILWMCRKGGRKLLDALHRGRKFLELVFFFNVPKKQFFGFLGGILGTFNF